jgi:hypothetical protein
MNMAGFSSSGGVLVDTNLLVLFAVGTVNRNRVENFKRTRQYRKGDYDLLVKVLGYFRAQYTLTHIMAEVSNLTDLNEPERTLARRVVAKTIAVFEEPPISSLRAAGGALYEKLGLTDSAIAIVAREQRCSVLTDDFDLYHSLEKENLPVLKFSYLQATVMSQGAF